jgi:hypothetical protein
MARSLFLWCLTVAGSALVLTQSTLTAPVRAQLARSVRFRTLGKLLTCPMCSGFWLGIGGALALVSEAHGLVLFCYGFAGSLVSALGVGLWLLLGELTAAAGLYRFREQLPPGLHLERIRLAERLGSSATQVACPRFDCDATKGEQCQVP